MKKLLFLFLIGFLSPHRCNTMTTQPQPLIPCTWGNCKTRVSDQSRLQAHLKAHKECDGTYLVCQNQECKMAFYKPSSLKQHYMRKHPQLLLSVISKIQKEKPMPDSNKKKKCKKNTRPKNAKLPVAPINLPPTKTLLQIPSPALLSTAVSSSQCASPKDLIQKKVEINKPAAVGYKLYCDSLSKMSPHLKNVHHSVSALPPSKKRTVIYAHAIQAYDPGTDNHQKKECCQKFEQHSVLFKKHVFARHPEQYDVHVCCRLCTHD